MTYNQKSVRDWMLKFGQNCPEKPVQLDEKTAKLRAKLILEEALETICKGLGIRVNIYQAGCEGYVQLSESLLKDLVIDLTKDKEVDLVELADGVSDLMVVSEGTAVAAGIDTEEIHNEVCRSNDSKLWKPSEVVQKFNYQEPTENSKIYAAENGVIIEFIGENLTDGREFLIKDKDGKVVKSPSYSPANILPILEKQIKG